MEKTGFYIIKENFFDIVNDPFLKGNKQGNRPHYYCFKESNTGIYWIIPMSSKLEKYKKIIKNKEKRELNVIFYISQNWIIIKKVCF